MYPQLLCMLSVPSTYQIKCSQMCEWLERYHRGTEQHCTRLQDEIESRLFPPCIQLRLTYAKDPTTWTSRQNVSLVVKRIMAPTDPIQFPIQVKAPDSDLNGKKWKHTASSGMSIVETVSGCGDYVCFHT